MRLPTLPPFSPKHAEERLRLLATGFQNAALAVLLGVLILPAFNGSPVLSFPVRLGAFVIAGITESLALILLRYIPQPPNP